MRRTAVASLVLSGLFIAGCGAPQSLPFSSQDGISTPMSAEPAAVSSDAGSSCSESSCPIPGNTWSGGEKKPLKPAMHCPGNGDMVLVEGQYCSRPNHDLPAADETGAADPTCAEYMEPTCSMGSKSQFCKMARCKRYKPEAQKCLVATKPISVCIDKFEYHDEGDELPATDTVMDLVSKKRVPLDFHNAKKVCEEQGKRLCLETEWEQACQSDNNYPYPTGLERPSSPVCNLDNIIHTDKFGRPLRSMLKPNSELMSCVSLYGVVAMSGDADEITVRNRSAAPSKPKEIGAGRSNALKGGWSGGIRGRCHPATTAHSDEFHEGQLGFRCCADPVSR